MAGGTSSAPPALTPPPGHPRFPLFDGLRAVAALSVVVYHAGYYSRANEGPTGLSPYLARLNVGVAVFFLISGFLLYRPLLAARAGDGPAVRARDYARRRALRIVPAYWVALTLLALYPGLPDLFSRRWWLYYGFAQDYGRHVVDGIGPAWTLGCEVVFYAALPLLSSAFSRAATGRGRRVWWQLEMAVLTVLIGLSAVYRALAATDGALPASTFASTFGWFALGMILALASVVGHRSRRGWMRALPRFAWGGWVVAAVAYVGLCRGLGLGSGFVFFEPVSAPQSLAVYALSAVVALGLALPAVWEGERRSAAGRLLAWPPLAGLGLISYGVYLYHQPIARALNGGIDRTGGSGLRMLWLAPTTTALAVLAGAVSYVVIERPVLRLKDRRSRTPMPQRPLAPDRL